ncbi:hypothetical protein [Microbacterium xanthum]|uniref:hypothetical protein n=1 Tax=Microbacterium xanthum TaxID=3079794 RepID=UPI002AD1F03D|nr:hypothetical protein [Microbacterium sp. KSW-48]MDZ8172891.1 hypothetical protein [Microbacterium sp. KSW-48]
MDFALRPRGSRGVWLILCVSLLAVGIATLADLGPDVSYIAEHWSTIPEWVSDNVAGTASMAVIIPTLTAGVVALYGIRHRIGLFHYVLVASVAFASSIFFQAAIAQVLVELDSDWRTNCGLLVAAVGWLAVLALLAYSVIRASATFVSRKA